MATIAFCRGALRRHAVPTALALSSGLYLVGRQPPTRLDALVRSPSPPAAAASRAAGERPGVGWLDPEVVRQLSGGSLAGE